MVDIEAEDGFVRELRVLIGPSLSEAEGMTLSLQSAGEIRSHSTSEDERYSASFTVLQV